MAAMATTAAHDLKRISLMDSCIGSLYFSLLTKIKVQQAQVPERRLTNEIAGQH
jgi:hypothetical protein